MSVLIDWISQPQTAGGLLLVAMPGVGDVGKLAVDAVNSELDAEPVARIIHPSLPPFWLGNWPYDHYISFFFVCISVSL